MNSQKKNTPVNKISLRSTTKFHVGMCIGGLRDETLINARFGGSIFGGPPESGQIRSAGLAGHAVYYGKLGGVAVGGVVWIVHFLVDLLTVGYAVLVTQRHQLEAERRETIVPFRMDGPLMGGLTGSSAMRDEAVLSRRAN